MIGDLIGEWIKGILIDGIMGNLSGLFRHGTAAFSICCNPCPKP